MEKYLNARNLSIIGIIVLAAFSRLLPHPPNVTPIMAIALFGGSYIKEKKLAFIIPITAMFLSDIALGFHSAMAAVYLSFVIAGFIGAVYLRKASAGRILIAALAASAIFFITTNFSAWLMDPAGLYPNTMAGLILCYEAALPFFRNSVAGNLVFTAVIFGCFALAERYIAFRLKDVRLKADG